MKNFTVVFISNVWSNEDDPSDHKEWKTVNAKSKQDAIDTLKGKAMVISCSED
jgi:hypothetical protein